MGQLGVESVDDGQVGAGHGGGLVETIIVSLGSMQLVADVKALS
jgi:hypothetical protein